MAVDVVDDGEFLPVEFSGGGGAGIIDKDDIEAFIGKGANGAGNALVRKNAADDDVPDGEIGKKQTQVGACQGAIRGFDDYDFLRQGCDLWKDPGVGRIFGEQQVVEPRSGMAERAVTAVFREAGNAGENDFATEFAELGEKALGVRQHDSSEALAKWRPSVPLGKVCIRCHREITDLKVDDEQSGLRRIEHDVREIVGNRFVIKRTIGMAPIFTHEERAAGDSGRIWPPSTTSE